VKSRGARERRRGRSGALIERGDEPRGGATFLSSVEKTDGGMTRRAWRGKYKHTVPALWRGLATGAKRKKTPQGIAKKHGMKRGEGKSKEEVHGPLIFDMGKKQNEIEE